MRNDQKGALITLHTCIGNLDIPDKQKKCIQAILEMLFNDVKIDQDSVVDMILEARLNPIVPIPELSKTYEDIEGVYCSSEELEKIFENVPELPECSSGDSVESIDDALSPKWHVEILESRGVVDHLEQGRKKLKRLKEKSG